MSPERDCIGADQNPTWSQPLPLFPVGSCSERMSLLVQILGQGSKTCRKHHTSEKSNFGQESIQVCKYLAIMGGRGRPGRVFTA